MALCHGLVLAGGLSTRMGHDKAKLRRNRQTMLEFTQTLLQSLGMEVLVSGGEEGIADVIPQAGPLAGIYTVIYEYTVDSLLIVPVDMPLLTAPVLQKLVNAGEQYGKATCYADCYLPLYLPVNKTLRDYLKYVFSEGSNEEGLCKPRSIKKMLSALDGIQLPVEDAGVLSNVNTPEEWNVAQQLITTNANSTHK
ncbi:MAG: molybdenum cofactor guanylyltransferase [Porticoccus sp.]|nr:molybdenum cofactor guanylyltransferase [Porticoccus sp.]